MGSNINLEEENSPINSVNHLEIKTRLKRKRVLVDTNEKNHSTPSPENEYEKLRQERITRNKQMLEKLQLNNLAQNLATAIISEQGNHSNTRPVTTAQTHRGPRKPKLLKPTRRSTRTRGISVNTDQYSTGENPSITNTNQQDYDNDNGDDQQGLLTQEAYFKLAGIDITNAIHSNGRYTGWVSDTVRTKYSIPSSPNSLPNTKGRSSSINNITTSNAKAFAATQLKTNPNSYFYRHVCPDERQAQGEWTDEEHAAFIHTVKTWGCGDKWGLFSSHIPQRVGYQCSAYYTNVIIPSGAIIDERFRLTRSGKPVFVG